MAASPGFIGKQHADKTRQKIQVTQIVHRLNKCALGDIEMKANELRAAEILLKKSLPDLQSVSISGDDGGPLVISWQQPS